MNRPGYAELLEAQMFAEAEHPTEQRRIARLEATITELREQLEEERRKVVTLTSIRAVS